MTPSRPGASGPAIVAERRWWDTAGAWLAIGTSPAALVFGAGIADRHDGPMPAAALVLGSTAIMCLLLAQGRLGLRPPHGEGWSLADILDAYTPRRDRRLVAALMALGMAGWLGFNAGLGGAALGSLLGAPRWVGVALLGLPLLALALAGQHRWNGPAVLTTMAALALIVLVAAQNSHTQAPLTLETGPWGLLFADVSVFVGYVAVFALRAPDFTAGLRGRADLWACATVLIVPTVVAAGAGATVALHDGSSDLVAHLQTSTVGTVLIVLAVAAPSLTAYHSGGLALRTVLGTSLRRCTLLIGAAGLALATSGFETVLLPWLTVLAAVLPPLIVPLAFEARSRRRGRTPVSVSAWSWLPAAVLGVALTAAGVLGAALVGLAAAFVSTAAVRGHGRMRTRRLARR